jgi:hypothetical protein
MKFSLLSANNQDGLCFVVEEVEKACNGKTIDDYNFLAMKQNCLFLQTEFGY